LKINAEFVKSAAGDGGFLRDGARAVALVGRSNVGKSSLINALARQRVARTSAAPGKTRLANIYRVQRGTAAPLFLVDLPGYGYARGEATPFARLVDQYFWSAGSGRLAPEGRASGALLLVDVRHPGLESDLLAWKWLKETDAPLGVVATKIDKLARGRRIRALKELESVFDDPVLPVSAVTGEGLDELWKLIDRPTTQRKPKSPSRNPREAGRHLPSA
jgi:GTP-binding protein